MELRRILICEDEKLIANRLERFVSLSIDFAADIHVVSTLNQALEFLAQNKVDLLFLDLNLHGRDGFDILKKLTAESFQTIIVSAYTEKAIEAFEYGVLDFIGKPFSLERLQKALKRFSTDETGGEKGLNHIVVKQRNGFEFIPIKDIDYIKASGIYAELVLLDGSIKVYDRPMNQLLKQLPERFKRIHKSFVIPIEEIKSIVHRRANTYNVELQSGSQVPISRAYRKRLLTTGPET